MSFLLELKGLLKLRVLQLFALSGMLAALAGITLGTKTPVMDADVWWHLKVGDWIIAHHAFPHVGIFSRTAANFPWMAYSWGYEVLLSRAYAWFGLIGLALYGVLLTGAVAAAFFWMLYRLSGNFWLSWALCGVGSLSFIFNTLPRPMFFSMIFLPIVLTLILEAHRSGSVRPLYWLPLVFVLWANFHIQFIYGLIVVGLYVGVNLLRPVLARWKFAQSFVTGPTLPPGGLLGIFAACVVACCIGPYTYHVFEVVFSYSRSKFPYAVLEELQPLDFKHPSDYILTVLAVGAFYAVIRRKDLALFRLALLSFASVLAFRALRDAWFLALPAAAFLADSPARKEERRPVMKLYEVAAVATIFAGMLFLVARNTGFNPRELDRTISRQYPVDSVNFLRRNPVPGPLYNEFGWGGFLIWYMPDYPVAIDGRTDLYGDEIDFMTYKSASGDYAADPYLKEAGVVLLPNEIPLTRRLTADPQFRVIYQDRISTVFARN